MYGDWHPGEMQFSHFLSLSLIFSHVFSFSFIFFHFLSHFEALRILGPFEVHFCTKMVPIYEELKNMKLYVYWALTLPL